jgi:hypothetical protein
MLFEDRTQWLEERTDIFNLGAEVAGKLHSGADRAGHLVGRYG